MNKRYSTYRLEFIRKAYQEMSVTEVTNAFNSRFKENKKVSAIKSVLCNHNFWRGRRLGGNPMRATRLYTREEVRFLRENYTGRSVEELTSVFNKHFNNNKTKKQIRHFVHNRGLKSGRTGHFEKGRLPWNVGTKGVMKGNSGNFKKGHKHKNWKPLGTERVCSKDDFILIKIAEQDPHRGFSTRYKHKHVVVWEKKHGPVPSGKVVMFKDGNNRNFDISNLILLTRAELLRLNKHKYKNLPNELKPSVLTLSKLEAKTHERVKGK